jgi:hypothetical protein
MGILLARCEEWIYGMMIWYDRTRIWGWGWRIGCGSHTWGFGGFLFFLFLFFV